MEQTPNFAAPTQRVHFLDSARALFMLLGIPFHAALAYNLSPWLVHSPEASSSLEWLAPIITAFRMPGFFLIAGYFAALLLERRTPGDWFKARTVRLGVPLLAGMALIVPLQNVLLRAGLSSGAVTYPDSASGLLLSHLWFLPVLLTLCAGLALGWSVIERIRWPDMPVWAIGLVIGVWLVGLRSMESVLGFNFSFAGGLVDLQSALRYLPFLLLGVAARRNAAILARMTRFEPAMLALGLVALALYCLTWQPETRFDIVAGKLAGAIVATCLVQALLALLAKYCDRPSPLVGRMVDASFSIYLFHHPIVIGMAIALLSVTLPPLVEWGLICAVALVLSFALHRLLRRSPLLLFLFNGVSLKHREGVLVAASARRPS